MLTKEILYVLLQNASKYVIRMTYFRHKVIRVKQHSTDEVVRLQHLLSENPVSFQCILEKEAFAMFRRKKRTYTSIFWYCLKVGRICFFCRGVTLGLLVICKSLSRYC